MKFNKNITAFGRHETFPLRYSWLTKGFNQFLANPNLFESDNATVALGVGKNMVKSIRHWLLAAQLVGYENKKLVPTTFGQTIMPIVAGYDPYLEDEATDWLVHWNLCTNTEQATSLFWLFNIFNLTEFSADDAQSALIDYLRKYDEIRFTAGTIKTDINVLLKMYTTTTSTNKKNSDYDLISPVSSLRLILYSPQLKSYISKLSPHRNIPEVALGYALLTCFEKFQTRELALNDLLYSQNGNINLSNIFRTNEAALMFGIEQLCANYPNLFMLREQAGLRQLFFKDSAEPNPISFLANHYCRTKDND